MRPMNFRDVGEALNRLAGHLVMPERRLYRCGRLAGIADAAELGAPATILSLCQSGGDARLGARHWLIPAPDREQTYEAGCRETRRWLRRAFAALADPATRCPVLIHCTAGKDRTGVVVALLLVGLGVARELAVKEYLLSEGVSDARRIRAFLEQADATPRYLGPVEFSPLREKFLSPPATSP